MQAKPNDAKEAVALLREAMGEIAEILTGSSDEATILSTLEQYFLNPKSRIGYEGVWLYREDTLGDSCAESSEVMGAINCYLGDEARSLDEPILRHLHTIGIAQNIEVECEKGDFYIDSLAVKPQHRNRGIARKLIMHAILRAKTMNVQRVSLLVDCDKISLKEYYARLGFSDDGERLIGGHRYTRMIYPKE
ncbi:MAG: GNAT family N-acetyltransferase [Wolinella sp.]